MKKTTKKWAALGLALVMGATVGISAYFTGTDIKSDGYTIGQVEIALNSTEDFQVEKLTPLEEYTFQRNITNTGINDAYVFMTVTIPYTQWVIDNNLDGTIANNWITGEYEQFFSYGTEAGEAGVNEGWQLVEVGRFNSNEIKEIDEFKMAFRTGDYAAIGGSGITYVYAYVGDNTDNTLEILSPDETTPNLFDIMKFNNFTQDDLDTSGKGYTAHNIAGQVKVNAYAIQTLNVKTDVAFTGDNADGTADVETVWAVVMNACAQKEKVEGVVSGIKLFPGAVDEAMMEELPSDLYNYLNSEIYFGSVMPGDDLNIRVTSPDGIVQEFFFTEYEVIETDATSGQVRFVSDAADFTNVTTGEFDDGWGGTADSSDWGISIEGNKLVLTVNYNLG